MYSIYSILINQLSKLTKTFFKQCIPCGYHFVFPKADIPRSVAVSPPSVISQPLTMQGSLTQRQSIDCSNPGCTRRGCIPCSRRMCRQCCIAQSGCNVRSHTLAQLSARQRGKLPEPSATPQADEFPLDPSLYAMSSGASYEFQDPHFVHPSPPVSHLNDEEKQQFEAAITTSLQPTTTAFIFPSTTEEDQLQYAAAITASLRLPDTLSPSSPQVSMSSHPPSEFQGSVSTAGPGSSRPAIHVTSHSSTTPSTKVRTVPYRPPNIKEHMSEDWMRPPEDRTKKPKRVNRINLDNRFSLVFWYEVCYLVA